MTDDVYKTKRRLFSVPGDLLDIDKCSLSNHTHKQYILHRKWPYVNSSEEMEVYVITMIISSYTLIRECAHVLK